MTDTELSALEAAAKAATPGPWYSYTDGSLAWEHERNPSVSLRFYKNNAAFIAAASPDVVLELIVELRQARADACEWIDMARWLAREMGGGVIPETQWLIIARQAVKEEREAAKEATCLKN